MNIDRHLVAVRQARLAADAADAELEAFVRRYGRPGTISGEKLTTEQRAEYRRLMTTAEALYGSWAELKYGTQ